MPVCYRHPGRETYIRCQRCDRPICPDCMRDAAVGFQCPECVAQGAKNTRAAKTAYGGVRSENPQLTSLVLVALNAGVWLLITATGGAGSFLLDRLGLIAAGRCEPAGQAGYYPGVSQQLCQAEGKSFTWVNGVSDGAVWQLITSAFSHVEIWHIAFNMLALWLLGPQLETVIGRARFLVLYLVSALAGSVCVYWFSAPQVETVGASGAIFGLMGALLMVAIKVGGDVRSILAWIGINAVITVAGSSFISWQGHLGGFAGGLAISAVMIYAPRGRRLIWQTAGTSAVAVALIILIAVRTVQLG